MTCRRIAADFRAHIAAPGVTLSFDETRLRPSLLLHSATSS
jgi:hypothetical protein